MTLLTLLLVVVWLMTVLAGLNYWQQDKLAKLRPLLAISVIVAALFAVFSLLNQMRTVSEQTELPVSDDTIYSDPISEYNDQQSAELLSIVGRQFPLEAPKNSDSGNFSRNGFELAADNSLIDLDKIVGGGVARDQIPALDNPQFLSPADVDFVDANQLGVVVSHSEQVKFYPYNILVWHEIVNDEIAGQSIVVTFCPLCGSGIVYSRQVGQGQYSFAVSGLLYESNLLMYDRQTDTLWSQIEGRAVAGQLSGEKLQLIDADLMAYSQATDSYPQLQVLSVETGYDRNYQQYPYGDYDTSDELIFPTTTNDSRLHPKTIMYATEVDGLPVAVVFDKLREMGQISVEIGSEDQVEFYYDQAGSSVSYKGDLLPGFYAQWFSWANHNLETGIYNN